MELLIFPFLPENAHRFENVSRAGYTYSPGNNRLRRHLESVRSRYACQCNTLGGSSELMQIVFRIGSAIPGSVPSLPASPQGPRNRDHPKSWMRRRMSWSSEGYRSCYASSLDSGTITLHFLFGTGWSAGSKRTNVLSSSKTGRSPAGNRVRPRRW